MGPSGHRAIGAVHIQFPGPAAGRLHGSPLAAPLAMSAPARPCLDRPCQALPGPARPCAGSSHAIQPNRGECPSTHRSIPSAAFRSFPAAGNRPRFNSVSLVNRSGDSRHLSKTRTQRLSAHACCPYHPSLPLRHSLEHHLPLHPTPKSRAGPDRSLYPPITLYCQRLIVMGVASHAHMSVMPIMIMIRRAAFRKPRKADIAVLSLARFANGAGWWVPPPGGRVGHPGANGRSIANRSPVPWAGCPTYGRFGGSESQKSRRRDAIVSVEGSRLGTSGILENLRCQTLARSPKRSGQSMAMTMTMAMAMAMAVQCQKRAHNRAIRKRILP
jgi:hypothetical protein